MNVTPVRRDVTGPLPSLGLAAGAGSAGALLATYWDDSWHTDKGRDDFAIPPHLLLYGGVLIAAVAVAVWGLLAWRRAGWGLSGVRAVLKDPALLLAAIGGATTLASAPIDAAWHEAYGRDAVLWSPPHLTAVLGTLGLSVGLLAGLRRVPGRAASTARLVAAASVIGTLQVPVLEYDSDVPQFGVVWFLPVAALGACLAVALLDDLLPGRWQATRAAVLYTVLRAATVAFLFAAGFSLTAVPPVALLIAVDAAFLRRRSLAARLVVLGAVAPLLWWPFLQVQQGVATAVPARLLPASVLLGALAGAAVAIAHGDLRPRSLAPAAAITATVLAVLVVPPEQPSAWAHDPGQGREVRTGELTVNRSGERATLAMRLDGPCGRLTAGRTTARRAGGTATGPLRISAPSPDVCLLEGAVAGLGEGRWFVYAEVSDGAGRTLEAWLPADSDETTASLRPLYEPQAQNGTATRNTAGAALLLIVAGLVVACLRLARRSGRDNA